MSQRNQPVVRVAVGVAVIVSMLLTMFPTVSAHPVDQMSRRAETPETAPSRFTVTFEESGLPTSALWEVGTSPIGDPYVTYSNSTSTTIVQSLTNGTYEFAALTVANYSAEPVGFSFTVNGATLAVSVPFASGTPVTFAESGLPAGTAWYVALRNLTAELNLSAVGPTLVAYLGSGTYAFATYALGYNSTPANGTVSVPSTGPIVLPLTFNRTPVGYLAGLVDVVTAQIWVNGISYGYTSAGGFTYILAPGIYTVIASASGYVTWSGYAQVHSGEVTNLYLVLSPVNTAVSPAPPRPFTATDEWTMIGLVLGVVVLGALLGEVWVRGRTPKKPEPAD